MTYEKDDVCLAYIHLAKEIYESTNDWWAVYEWLYDNLPARYAVDIHDYTGYATAGIKVLMQGKERNNTMYMYASGNRPHIVLGVWKTVE